MGDVLNFDFLMATLRMATPLLFAAMGGLISERSGVMNIALEGLMLIGAFSAVAGTHYLGDPWLGLLCAVVIAGIGAAIHAFWCITLRADQIVAGTAINLLGLGATAFLIQANLGSRWTVRSGGEVADNRARSEHLGPGCVHPRADHPLLLVHNEAGIKGASIG